MPREAGVPAWADLTEADRRSTLANLAAERDEQHARRRAAEAKRDDYHRWLQVAEADRDRLASLLGRCVPFIRNNTRHPLGCPACGVDGCAFHGPCECGLTALLADLLTEMEP